MSSFPSLPIEPHTLPFPEKAYRQLQQWFPDLGENIPQFEWHHFNLGLRTTLSGSLKITERKIRLATGNKADLSSIKDLEFKRDVLAQSINWIECWGAAEKEQRDRARRTGQPTPSVGKPANMPVETPVNRNVKPKSDSSSQVGENGIKPKPVPKLEYGNILGRARNEGITVEVSVDVTDIPSKLSPTDRQTLHVTLKRLGAGLPVAAVMQALGATDFGQDFLDFTIPPDQLKRSSTGSPINFTPSMRKIGWGFKYADGRNVTLGDMVKAIKDGLEDPVLNCTLTRKWKGVQTYKPAESKHFQSIPDGASDLQFDPSRLIWRCNRLIANQQNNKESLQELQVLLKALQRELAGDEELGRKVSAEIPGYHEEAADLAQRVHIQGTTPPREPDSPPHQYRITRSPSRRRANREREKKKRSVDSYTLGTASPVRGRDDGRNAMLPEITQSSISRESSVSGKPAAPEEPPRGRSREQKPEPVVSGWDIPDMRRQRAPKIPYPTRDSAQRQKATIQKSMPLTADLKATNTAQQPLQQKDPHTESKDANMRQNVTEVPHKQEQVSTETSNAVTKANMPEKSAATTTEQVQPEPEEKSISEHDDSTGVESDLRFVLEAHHLQPEQQNGAASNDSLTVEPSASPKQSTLEDFVEDDDSVDLAFVMEPLTDSAATAMQENYQQEPAQSVAFDDTDSELKFVMEPSGNRAATPTQESYSVAKSIASDDTDSTELKFVMEPAEKNVEKSAEDDKRDDSAVKKEGSVVASDTDDDPSLHFIMPPLGLTTATAVEPKATTKEPKQGGDDVTDDSDDEDPELVFTFTGTTAPKPKNSNGSATVAAPQDNDLTAHSSTPVNIDSSDSSFVQVKDVEPEVKAAAAAIEDDSDDEELVFRMPALTNKGNVGNGNQSASDNNEQIKPAPQSEDAMDNSSAFGDLSFFNKEDGFRRLSGQKQTSAAPLNGGDLISFD